MFCADRALVLALDLSMKKAPPSSVSAPEPVEELVCEPALMRELPASWPESLATAFMLLVFTVPPTLSPVVPVTCCKPSGFFSVFGCSSSGKLAPSSPDRFRKDSRQGKVTSVSRKMCSSKRLSTSCDDVRAREASRSKYRHHLRC